MEQITLPSVYQQDDNVWYLGHQAKVIGIHFKGLTVTYDLIIQFSKEGKDYERRAYNVDELMIEREKPYNKFKVAMENSDAFHLFLRQHGINYSASGMGTMIGDDMDMFWLGQKWSAYKVAHGQPIFGSKE